jgi:probable O-glycosylation ligase (exosortase A-associated)
LQNEVDQLKQLDSRLRRDIGTFAPTEGKLDALARAVLTARENYDELASRYEVSKTSEALTNFGAPDRIQVVADPLSPALRAPPRYSVFVAAGIAAALAIGAALAAVAELLDQRLRRSVDFARIFNVPVMARVGGRERPQPGADLGSGTAQQQDPGSPAFDPTRGRAWPSRTAARRADPAVGDVEVAAVGGRVDHAAREKAVPVRSIPSAFIPCLIFIIFSHFRIHEAFPVLFDLHIPQILAIITLGSLLYHLLVTSSIKPFWSPELILLLIFFALATFGILFAFDRPAALSYWSNTFIKIVIMAIAIAWTTRTPSDFALAARWFIVAGTVVALVAIYNKVNGIGLVEGTRVTIGRTLGSLLGDPNDLALTLLFPLGFAGAFALGRVGFADRLLGLVGSVTVGLAIVATQSRGGLLGVVGVLFVLASSRVRSKAILVAGGIAMAVALYSFAAISDRQSGGGREPVIDESAQGRLTAWETAWNMAKARPLTGVGLVNSVGAYYFFTPVWQGSNHAVHSTWLGVLAETGFPGFFVFVTMVVAVTRTSLTSLRFFRGGQADPRMRATSLALVASITGFCVSGTFLTQGMNWPLYILLGLTVAMRHWREAEQSVELTLPQLEPVPLRS